MKKQKILLRLLFVATVLVSGTYSALAVPADFCNLSVTSTLNNTTNESYCVKLAETPTSLSIDLTEKITSIKGAQGIKKNGLYQFFSPDYTSMEELEIAFVSFLKLGFGNAEKMVSIGDERYTFEEYRKIRADF